MSTYDYTAPRARYIAIEHTRAGKLRETAEAVRNGDRSGTLTAERLEELADEAEANARRIAARFSGSGFTELEIDDDRTTPEELVLTGEYHVMDGESGMYVGYIGFTAIVTAAAISDYTPYTLTIERAPSWTDEIEEEYDLQEFIGDTLYSYLLDESLARAEALRD